MFAELSQVSPTNAPHTPEQVVLTLLIAFLLSQAMAWLYVWTYEGLGYSRPFVHALVLSSMVTCIVIVAVGDSLARGLGILGTLTVVRFRTQVRDPRDILFLFACLGLGIASGSGAFLVAIIGAMGFGLVALYLHLSPFASLRQYEGLLRFIAPAGVTDGGELGNLFAAYCSSARLVSVREATQGSEFEYAYQIQLVDPSYQSELLQEMRQIRELSEPSLLMHRATVEL